ncbi:MAG: hypothetical protein V1716_01460 [Candidatus Uhrbacteria bacterium]
MKGFLFRVKEGFLSLFSLKSGRLKKLIVPVVFLGIIFAFPTHAELTTVEIVDKLLSILAQIIISMAQVVGQVIVLLISAIVVPLLQYNDFASSPAVGVGWAVIRDAVNMFFVLILIAIAFGTILGGLDRFKWRQQVPRLLLVAIFINFSRMLCGIMIDFSQVIMMTFVSAIKDIAGGNFIQMMGLENIMAVSKWSILFSDTATSGGVKPFDLFAAAIISFMLMLIVLVTLIFLALIIAFRIVTLWILVTIAPLAWFFKSTDGILKLKGDPYKTWWAQFSCCLQLGPVLVFFLWLALAVAGSGSIGETFPKSATNTETFNMLDMMSTSKIVGFIVSIALIFAGFKAADDACESGGLTGAMKSLTGKASGISKGIAMAPVAAAGAGAALAGRGALAGGKWLGNKAYTNTVGRGVNALKNTAGEKLGELAKSGRFKGTFIGQMAAKKSADLKAERAARAQATMEGKPLLSAAEMESRLSQGRPLDAESNQQDLVLARRALTDKDFRKGKTPEELRAIMDSKDPITGKTRMEDMEATFSGDAGFKKEMDAWKKEAPSLFGQEVLNEKIKEASDLDGVDAGQYQDKAFRDHVGGIDYTRMRNGVAEKIVKTKIVKNAAGEDEEVDDLTADGEKQYLKISDALEQGLMGLPKQKLWKDGEAKALEAASRAEASTPEKMAEVISKGSAEDIGKLKGRPGFDANAVMAAGLAGEKSPEKRAAFRQKLAESGLAKATVTGKPTNDEVFNLALEMQRAAGAGPDTDTAQDWQDRLNTARAELVKEKTTVDETGTFKAFDLREVGGGLSFEDNDARTDFSAAVKKNPRLVAQVYRNAKQQGYHSGDLLGAITPEAISGLFSQYRSASGDEQQQIGEEISFVLNDDSVQDQKDESNVWQRQFETIKEEMRMAESLAAAAAAAPAPTLPPDSIQAMELNVQAQRERIRQLQEMLRSRNTGTQSRSSVQEDLAQLMRETKELEKEVSRVRHNETMMNI